MRDGAKVIFHKLELHRNHKYWVLGREDTNAYFELEETPKKVLDQLRTHTLGEVERKNPTVDVRAFVSELAEAGFVASIGHRKMTKNTKIAELLHMSSNKLKFANTPFNTILFWGLITWALSWFMLNQQILPDVYWSLITGHLGVLIISISIIWWLVNLLHEIGHYLAIRATGQESKIHLVTDWHLILPRTDMKNLPFLSYVHQQRVQLAGLTMDLIVFLTSTLLWTNGIAEPLFQLIALVSFLDLVFHFTPVKHSDIMQWIGRKLAVKDVSKSFMNIIRQSCPFCRSSKKLTAEDKRLENVFPLLFASVFLLVIVLTYYVLPFLQLLIYDSFRGLITSSTISETGMFVDSLIAVILISGFISLYMVSLVREHPNNKQTWFVNLCVATHTLFNLVIVFILLSVFASFTTVPTAVAGMLFMGVLYGTLHLRFLGYINKRSNSAYNIMVVLVTFILFFILYAVVAPAPSTTFAVTFAVGLLLAQQLTL